MVVRAEHHSTLLSEYATIVNPPTQGQLLLVMVRNDPIVGAGHEIAEVLVTNPAEPTTRRFVRTSVSPHH